MTTNPLLRIQEFGQSIWLDYINRNLMTSGELRRLIKEDGLRGITSNPSIFDKAIEGSTEYSESIRVLALKGKSVDQIYQELVVEDIRMACDMFRSLYDKSDGKYGFVSLEVSPKLARQPDVEFMEGYNLWKAVDRPNVLIKIPGVAEGIEVIRKLIAEGININVTLLFGLDRYRQVVDAYISGIEERLAAGKSVKNITSVASFFLSRIDVMVDPMLKDIVKKGRPDAHTAERLVGETAIACAKEAYQIYKELFFNSRFARCAKEGAKIQQLLWASTSTKNPNYPDIKYVEPLIGPDTINTLPPETLDAYRDHGNPAARLEQDLDKSRGVLNKLAELGIDLANVTIDLEKEGIDKFIKPFDKLAATLSKKSEEALAEKGDSKR
jgi:transaldolase